MADALGTVAEPAIVGEIDPAQPMFVPDFEGDSLGVDGVDDRTEEDRPLGLGEAAFLGAGRADSLSRLGRC